MSFTFFDISDMLFYLDHHRHVSGIQRTQSNLVRSICMAGADFRDVHFLCLDEDRSGFRTLDKSALSVLTVAIPDLDVDHAAIKLSIKDMTVGGPPPTFRPDDIYVVTGAFWIYDTIYGLYNRLKQQGVIIGSYIYDIIPITQPDYCTGELTSSFTRAFHRATHFFDFMVTISDHTRREVDGYILSARLPETVTETVRLAHTMNDHPPEDDFELDGLRFNDFVLCVGTIEARKNHQLLYQVWKLLSESGVSPMPKLVIVGRWGWRVDDLKAQLAATDGLGGSIVVLPQVDDETLALLYRECKFTVFPSFVEGWGLPVGESLVHGRFCLASRTSSIPEVGGDFVDYIDPYNARGAYEAVLKYLSVPALLADKHDRIRSEFVARTWDDVRDELVATASRCAARVRANCKPPVYPVLRFGTPVDASNRRGSSPAPAATEAPAGDVDLAFADGWDVPEDLGRWMRGRTAKLAFRLEARADICAVALELFSVPWVSGNTLQVSCRATKVSRVVPAGQKFDVGLDVDLSTAGSEPVEVDLELTGDYRYDFDPRSLCVGLSTLAVTLKT